MSEFFCRPWDSQPQGVPVAWDSPFASGALAIFDGERLHTPRGITLPLYATAAFGVSPMGRSAIISGAADSVLAYDIGSTLSASDPCSIEFVLYGSAFPSLAALLTLSPTSLATGAVNAVFVENGAMRGALAFTGGPPCDIYAWGGSQDVDSNVQFEVGKQQHILITKAAGTGAAQITVYRNGVRVAQGNSSNGQPWATSGPYLYIGGRHYSSAASVTGAISAAGIYRRVIGPAEAAQRHNALGELFEPRRIFIPVAAGVGGVPTLSLPTYVPGSLTSVGFRPRVTAT